MLCKLDKVLLWQASSSSNSNCKLFLCCQSICHRLKRSSTFSRSPFCFLHEYRGFVAEILPSVTAFFVRNWRLQLDNTTAHRSQAAQHALLQNAVPEVFFQPACLPDMNPIENGWALMKRRVVARRLSTASRHHGKMGSLNSRGG